MLAGDEKAFDAFFEAHFPRLYRFALARVREPDAAEEVTQASLAIAIRKLHTWRGEAALFTWLCTLCRNEIAAHYRRQDRRPDLRSIDDYPEIRASLEALASSEADRPDTAFDRGEVARLVQLTLDYLPARYADVLEWKYIHGLAVREIADRLHSTPKAVESLLTRARQAFREAFAVLTQTLAPDQPLD
jgi:RNA polymerase sigma-70 factor (ECF subfamily)